MDEHDRARLVRALVQRVDVDEASGEVTVVLTNLQAESAPGVDKAKPPPAEIADSRPLAHNANASQPIEVTA